MSFSSVVGDDQAPAQSSISFSKSEVAIMCSFLYSVLAKGPHFHQCVSLTIEHVLSLGSNWLPSTPNLLQSPANFYVGGLFLGDMDVFCLMRSRASSFLHTLS